MEFSKRAKGGPGNISHCLVDGCNADLNLCRDYHRRHKVCEVHSKTAKVTIAGREQRFCQQCSRFHSLVEFDEGKRSCRKRLDGHNRRRRKPQPDSRLARNNNTRLLSFNNNSPPSSFKPEIYNQHRMYFNERPNNHIQFLQGDNSLHPTDHALSLLSSTRPEVNGLRHYGSGYSFGPETAAESSTPPSLGSSSSSNVWPTLNFPTVFQHGGEGSSASGSHQTLSFMYGSNV